MKQASERHVEEFRGKIQDLERDVEVVRQDRDSYSTQLQEAEDEIELMRGERDGFSVQLDDALEVCFPPFARCK